MVSGDRPLFVLPFRVVVWILAGIFLISLLGGALGGWLVVRRLPLPPSGERVVERVERQLAPDAALVSAVADLEQSVTALLDERERVVGTAVALTQDGLLASTGPRPAGPLRVLRPSGGDPLPADIVRVYPEAGVFFLRTASTFSVPRLAREATVPPGSLLAAAAVAPDSVGPRVWTGRVEVLRLRRGRRSPLDVSLVPALGGSVPPSFRGAPAVAPDGELRGLLALDADSAFLVPAGVIEVLLRDALAHQGDTAVSVRTGLRGQWQHSTIQGARESVLPALAFQVTDVLPDSPAAASGFRAGDRIDRFGTSLLTGGAPLLEPLLTAARAAATVDLAVQRGAETLTVRLSPTVVP